MSQLRQLHARTARAIGSQPELDGGRRRQGIFWIITAPVANTVCGLLATGTLPAGAVWCRGQREKGAHTGYEHYQFVVAFDKKKSLRAVCGVFGEGIHAEITRSAAANDYCGKEDTRIGETFEYGRRPIVRNSAKDWDAIWDAAKRGDLDSIPAQIRVVSYRTLRTIEADFAVPREFEREVWCFWGPTASGKSRRAWAEAGMDAYSKCPLSKFWNGYQGQTEVVIDEFRGGIAISHMLRWCDRYPCHLEIKGASRPMDVERIWITSNLHPRQWYPDLDEVTVEALMRRMTILEFPQ